MTCLWVCRKALLRLGKFFECECVRCCDASELGTYTSALVCHKCDKARQKAKDKQPFGRVLPSDLTNEASDWVCDSCGDKVKADVVTGRVAKIKAEAERLDADPKVRNQGNLLPQWSQIQLEYWCTRFEQYSSVFAFVFISNLFKKCSEIAYWFK